MGLSVEKVIRERGIESALHFTTNRGLVGTLAVKALLSRYRLQDQHQLEHVLHVNAAKRPEAAADFDKSANWLDYVNLSISEVNTRFLRVSRRWHNNADVWWCILDFDSTVMTHDDVFFATTNNSYHLCKRGAGAHGLQALFAPVVHRKEQWSVTRHGRQTHLPTCEQAEVLYPKSLETKYLKFVYVESNDHHDVVGGWLQEFGLDDVDVIVSSAIFRGCTN